MIILTERQQELLAKIAHKYSLELLLLFGSQATGKTHAESDYDIAYLSSRTLDLEEEGRLINGLLVIAKQRDERLINLVNMGKANPLLFYAMTSTCQLLYERVPATFATMRAYAFKKYIETKPLYDVALSRLGHVIQSYDI